MCCGETGCRVKSLIADGRTSRGRGRKWGRGRGRGRGRGSSRGSEQYRCGYW